MSKISKAIEKAEKKLAVLEAAHVRVGMAIADANRAIAEAKALVSGLDVPPGGGKAPARSLDVPPGGGKAAKKKAAK